MARTYPIFLFIVAVVQMVNLRADEPDGWQNLFNGHSLDGWIQKNGTAKYEVTDGMIVGTTVEGSWNSFLCTEKEYSDFQLEFEVRVDDRLNSGVQIRSKTRDKTVGNGPNLAAGRVIGPQVEIEASKTDGGEAGYIYGEATGKGWLTPNDQLKPHSHFRDSQWNHFRIVARGPRIQTWINGDAIADLIDEETFAEYPQGFVGLQVHRIKAGDGPFSVAWRNIRIRELKPGFAYQHHFVDRDLPGSSWGQTALVDIDRDGDLDFITGRTKGDIRWYEFNNQDHSWTAHLLGRDSPSDVGGVAFDVDQDGRIDFVTGGAWYQQPQDAKSEPWPRYVFDTDDTKVHDIVAADIDGDGRDEIITLSDKSNLRVYRIPADNNQAGPWDVREIWKGVHAGLSAGDIDGDGDVDLVRSQVWLENVGGGQSWKEHKFCGIPWAERQEQYFYYLASRSWIADINRDGRLDIVLTENEIPGGRVAWFEAPEDPRQPAWTPHFLPTADDEQRGPYHSLQLADFDNDGDLDIFSGEMEHLANPPHRWFIWENAMGDGSQFIERVILDMQLGTHETRAGDIDGDGDIDLVGKLWRPVPDNGNLGHNHVDFLENRTISD
ncbi:MAG: DUF1080 domain-containing protein [Planctomycetales bacterium]|nr:DUF1080 domain-containing protein [Planctomycetales bacterium]